MILGLMIGLAVAFLVYMYMKVKVLRNTLVMRAANVVCSYVAMRAVQELVHDIVDAEVQDENARKRVYNLLDAEIDKQNPGVTFKKAE